jgi:hypothetical protein
MATRVRWATTTRVAHAADVGIRQVFVWCSGVEIAAAMAADGGKPWGWRVATLGRIEAQGMCATEREARRTAVALARRLAAPGARA